MLKSLNKVIKILILSDFFLQSGWGLIGPIFAVFLTGQISGGDIRVVGFAAAVYWIVKSILQPFIAHYLDKNHGEKDDYKFLVLGTYAASLIPLGYIFSTQPWHVYALEFFRAMAMACAVPTWYAIFTRHINKGREAFSWSIESTGIGFAAGFAGAIGAWLASAFGFKTVFILVSLLMIFSSTILLFVRKFIFLESQPVSRLPLAEKPM